MIDLLFPALLLSIVLLGIHSYFGIQIIKRGIIFTDLAIGQMAALGAAISLFFFHGEYIYFISLTFSIFGGLLIALASRRTMHLEAFIGLMYAFGISGVFILLSRSAHGMENFQNLMAYDIIFTQLDDIIRVGILYICIGIIIFYFNKWTTGYIREIFFFLTFSITVTSSVKLAGVLVVFAILVSPALISIQIISKPRIKKISRGNPILIAWVIGILINLLSVIVSYKLDLPTGYTLVFMHSFLAVIVSLLLKNKE